MEGVHLISDTWYTLIHRIGSRTSRWKGGANPTGGPDLRQERFLVICENERIRIGGSTYKNFRRTPPYGTQFFRFHINFHLKAPALEVLTPHGKSWIRPLIGFNLGSGLRRACAGGIPLDLPMIFVPIYILSLLKLRSTGERVNS